MDLETGVGGMPVRLEWLEGALEHAYANGQIKALAYLEAVMEDWVFEEESAAKREVFGVG